MKTIAFRRDSRGRLTSTSLAPANFMPFRGISPLLSRPVRVGPELGLFAWFPAERGASEAANLDAALQRPPVDLPTGLRLTRTQFRTGLNFWIRAHEPAMIVLQAEGALVETGIVPGFGNQWGSFATRERLTLGLFERADVALLAWQTGGARRRPERAWRARYSRIRPARPTDRPLGRLRPGLAERRLTDRRRTGNSPRRQATTD